MGSKISKLRLDTFVYVTPTPSRTEQHILGMLCSMTAPGTVEVLWQLISNHTEVRPPPKFPQYNWDSFGKRACL